ncbi:MAG: YfhO family protein [Bacteroidetes bacterium]|nr:YfhO family protein [Bacteroidota bacterium]
MKNFQWKSLLPHAIAVGIFLVVSVIYCKPALEGKVLMQSDIMHWKGMAQDLVQYKEKTGHYPLWNNNLFGGMPAFQIAMESSNPASVGFLHSIFMFGLPKPIGFFFLLCISFYFLSQVVGSNSWLGVMGGIAYAYATYSPVIIIAGHETKLLAMGYLPAVMGALWLIYQRKYLWGLALTALFSGLLIGMNHLQVTYYFLLLAGFMSIAFAIQWIKDKDFKHLAVAFTLAILGGAIGAGSNLVNLATTSDFSKATMRGGSTLDSTANKSDKSVKATGLNTQYAFYYGSYGPAETLSFIVPGIYGGSSGGELTAESNFGRLALEKGIPEEQVSQFTASMSTYWGPQPMTSGPVYYGAVICFLFIFGMVYLKTWHRWWILAVCAFSILLSWGSNFAGFNEFVFNHMPLYNKFRAPSIILVLPQLLFPLVAVMALQQFLFVDKDRKAAIEKIKLAGYITGGLFALLAVLYVSFSYTSANDAGLKSYLGQIFKGDQDIVNSFFNALKDDRKALFGKDLIRSLVLAIGSITLLWLYAQNKIKQSYVLAGLVIISSIDLISIGKRYLNDNSFQEPESVNEAIYKMSPVDQEIMKDSSRPRVLNTTVGSYFNDATTAYHHRDIGGYSPVKLSIVEDLLNFQLKKQPINEQVLNMLNMKYVIVQNPQNGQQALQTNPGALGNVWFVKHLTYQNDPLTVMKAMDHFNPRDTAIIEAVSKKDISFEPVADSTATIQLVKNDNDLIEYTSSASSNQFAVFSEIYYNRGWKAYIDDKESTIIQTNYVLRGLAIPAGKHQIRFEFKPASYYESKKAATVSSALIWILLIAAVASSFKKEKSTEQKA